MPEQTQSQRVTTALFYGFLALLAWLTYMVFEPFVTPLIWAAVIVILFLPWHRRLDKRFGKSVAATISTVGATAILIVPTVMVMIAFVHQAVQALGSVEMGTFLARVQWLNHVWMWAARRIPGWSTVNLPTIAQEEARRIAGYLAGELGGVVRHVVVFLFDLVITIIAMFYFFRDADPIMRWVRRSLPFAEEQREVMISQAHDLVFVTVASSLAASGITGLVGALVFLLVGIHQVVFWGVMMALFALLPVLGAWMVWIPAAGWLVAQGHPGRAVALLLINGVAVLIIDDVLRPMMISGRVELNGLFVLVGVLGGIVVFGVIGVVLGPVVVAIAAGLLRAYTQPLSPPGSAEGPGTAVLE
jgi:predicted PurR-regulated permease PerM